jgi:photosystem II stability/assembly factor-like uncharacterized protein
MYTCSQHVWKTTNDGQTWEKISPDLTYADPETLGPTGGIITNDMNGPEIYATVFALAPSNHDVNVIWAGSDDGKVHITRNGGKKWTDITPKELPKFSRVSIIEESKFSSGTLYLAANRYQVDDRSPYVFKTTDYGQSWTRIVNGINEGHFARSIREDLKMPGLLYLGTEHGVYISFDDGDSWQSLQLNLPDTPIRDLVLRNSDIVLGSHGRSFWILDDIEPLRQAKTLSTDQELILFQPANAIRGAYNANITYYLKNEADSVTVEILDKNGEVINTFTGTETEYKPDPNISFWRKAGSTVPTTAKGLNSFTWDLRYQGATSFEGMIVWSARPKHGPYAPIGEYQVRVKLGDKISTQPIHIEMNPNLQGVTEEDLIAQFELAIKIRNKTSIANETVIQIRSIRKQANELLKSNEDDQLVKSLNGMLEKMKVIEEDLYQVKNQSDQDPLNFPIKLNNRLSSLRRSIENGQAKPTDAAYVVFDELSKELSGHLNKMNQLLNNELTSINSTLKTKGLNEITE